MIKKFLNFTEIQTKITSFFTFLLTLGFMVLQGIEIKIIPTLVFFLSMLIFDLCTTAINNYIDAKGNGQKLNFSQKTSFNLIVAMFLISVGLGLYLVWISDLIVLVLGAFCFAVGVLYTYGPVPISRQAYGEIISGIMYGFFIPFLLIHVNDPSSIIGFTIKGGQLILSLEIMIFIKFIFVFMIPTLLTSSIMLANNTCDIEKDVVVKRFTLPYYLGQEVSVKLMYALYLGVYGTLVIAVILGGLPVTSLLTLITIPKVMNHLGQFKKDLIKHVSFKFIIKNFIMIMAVLVLSTAIGLMLF